MAIQDDKRVCSKCKRVKILSLEFNRSTGSKNGFRSECKDCQHVNNRLIRQSPTGKAYRKRYRIENLDKIRRQDRERWRAKRLFIPRKAKLTPEQKKERRRNHYFENKVAICAKARIRRTENHAQISKQKAEYQRKRRESDPVFRTIETYRNRLRIAVKSQRGLKAKKSAQLLGCSVPNFILYLESKFEPGMTWANYGSEWELDHIVPCALFDLTKSEQQKVCFHFSNYQPLWRADNQRKGTKLFFKEGFLPL